MNKTRTHLHEGSLFASDSAAEALQNLPDIFRRLYYRLYSNSSASRAERLLENLATLLLLKFSLDKFDGHQALGQFLAGGGSAKGLVEEFLSRRIPKLAGLGFSFSLSDGLVREALADLGDIDLSIAPPHILGEAFQALIGPRLRGDRGQFFTPRSLVRAMVRIIAPEPHESVCDPACGTGGFLAEAHLFQMDHAKGSGAAIGRLVAIDKDPDLARLATAMLHIGTDGRANVLNANSLDLLELRSERLIKDLCFDVVLTNPPFGSRIAINDKTILRNYDLGHSWIRSDKGGWSLAPEVLDSQDPQILFIELCVKLLRAGGRMGIVLPEGVFGNRQEGYVWSWLRREGHVTALLDCPRTTFQPSTDTKTNVLFFRKNDAGEQPKPPAPTRIAVALSCGHDRRGRTRLPNGNKYPNDFERFSEAFSSNSTRTDPWKEVSLAGAGYLVPRYYVRKYAFTDKERGVINGAESVTIGGLAQRGVLTIRKGNEVGSHAYGSGDVPFVRTSDVANLEISTDPTKGVSDEVYEQYRVQQDLKPGDILMVVDGRYRIGTTAILSVNNCRCVIQSHLRVISVRKSESLTPYELLYALNLPSVRIQIRDLVFVQSTLGTLGPRLLELEIPLLHGKGPWEERVKRFEEVLRKRDALLTEIKEMAGPEIEL